MKKAERDGDYVGNGLTRPSCSQTVTVPSESGTPLTADNTAAGLDALHVPMTTKKGEVKQKGLSMDPAASREREPAPRPKRDDRNAGRFCGP